METEHDREEPQPELTTSYRDCCYALEHPCSAYQMLIHAGRKKEKI
jgi:hypothetical protein